MRIKNKEEFKREFGDGWRNYAICFPEEMDYLLSATLLPRDKLTIMNNGKFQLFDPASRKTWTIASYMCAQDKMEYLKERLHED